jgi:hypothetical protein
MTTKDLIEVIAETVSKNITVLVGNPTKEALNLRECTLAYTTNLDGKPVLIIEYDQFYTMSVCEED